MKLLFDIINIINIDFSFFFLQTNEMKFLSLYIVHILFQIGCVSNAKTLADYQEINTFFNQNEVKGLNDLMTFFDNAICLTDDFESTNTSLCYDHFFEKILKGVKSGGRNGDQIPIAIDEQREYISLMDQSLFNEIWIHSCAKNKYHNDVDIINLKHNGKYIKFLREFAKVNPKVKKYYDLFESFGTIVPSMNADIVYNYKDYDMTDHRIRLLIVIHCLTVNYMSELI